MRKISPVADSTRLARHAAARSRAPNPSGSRASSHPDVPATRHQALPEIGDTVTPRRAAALARQLGRPELASRIEAHPERYVDWVFDGASGIDDRFLGALTGTAWRDLTEQAALPHDLQYAYGEPGDAEGRRSADAAFYENLVTKVGMNRALAGLLYAAVRVGGQESFLHLPWQWGFAHRQPRPTAT